MDWRRFVIWSVIATFGIGGIALVADALVETDEERIEAIADGLTGRDSGRRLERLNASIDTTRTRLTIRQHGNADRFGENDEDPSFAVQESLEEFTHADLELVQRNIRVDGDDAELVIRARTEGELTNLRCEFERDGQRWLLREIHVFH